MRLKFSVSFDVSRRAKEPPSKRGHECQVVHGGGDVADVAVNENTQSAPFLKSVFQDYVKRLESKGIIKASPWRGPLAACLWLMSELLIGGLATECMIRSSEISTVVYVSAGASAGILFLVLLSIHFRQIAISRQQSGAYRELGELFHDRGISTGTQVLALMLDNVHRLETDMSKSFKSPAWSTPGLLLGLAGAVFAALFTAVFALGRNGEFLSRDPALNLYQLAGAITIFYLCFYYAPKTVLGRPDIKVALFESALRDLQIDQELKPTA
ncbi:MULTISPECIES: hypothetical protein [Actinomycetaceae]|uniref:Uncharacterized protein n=1 Tax=Actinotignum sanguinis TaxID=1445614 RepID=A0ABT5V8I5_9ACTO|nr:MULTISPECIES: hypothetical protein [Actinotignum]MDE1552495.1 hypothetical protein [Actinotignum sanguinis]MDE1642041.1 hypothetical protein [Actinotignum sanguinis]MDE1656915.1 hypothetical protein [Actinotignum sanguinis]MDK6907281.1 hypothetical protein [Actinotignum timonense]MDK8353351.1 hypothetical protein [Actinotignum sanguinis]